MRAHEVWVSPSALGGHTRKKNIKKGCPKGAAFYIKIIR